tara:strand:- start:294 stop:443 length:150 start_codon:yes stop_codon:yes gene_type:complete
LTQAIHALIPPEAPKNPGLQAAHASAPSAPTDALNLPAAQLEQDVPTKY